MAGAMPYIGFDNDRLRGHLTGFYNCMSRLDECVGELLEELDKSGKADNTRVIYLGDHGAQFARGKVFVTEGGLRIPLIIRWPGKVDPGLISEQLVSTIDLLPTIVIAAGGKVPDYVPGEDLAGVLKGQSEPIRHYLFGERNCDSADLHFPQRAVRDSRYKLIKTLLSDRPDPAAHKCLVNGASNFRGSPTYEELKSAKKTTQAAYTTWLNPPEYQLYDLEKDRHEFFNIANDPDMVDVRQRLIERLDRWQQDTDDRLRLPELLTRLTKENDVCRQLKIRSPIGGWKYTEYLAPEIAREAKPVGVQPFIGESLD
jgi:N-sulfoglucosamine sulfohydrolase